MEAADSRIERLTQLAQRAYGGDLAYRIAPIEYVPGFWVRLHGRWGDLMFVRSPHALVVLEAALLVVAEHREKGFACAEDYEWFGHLCAYRAGQRLRNASEHERECSRAAMDREHAKGVFWLDGVEVYVDERPDMGGTKRREEG